MAVLFDLDGVLANSSAAIVSCMNEAFVALGYGARPAAEIETIIGPPIDEGIGSLLGLPPDSDAVAEAVVAYRARYETGLAATTPYPGIVDVVRELGRAQPLAVATSKGLRYAVPVLEAIGLGDAFTVVAAPVPGGSERKTVIVAEALARLDEPGVAMIGDRRYDIEAAHDHGLRAIGVTWGFGSRAELEAAGADVLVDAPADLPAALRPAAATEPPSSGRS
jgi:phosphoglycolate phosphatase